MSIAPVGQNQYCIDISIVDFFRFYFCIVVLYKYKYFIFQYIFPFLALWRNRRGEIIANYKIISLLGEGAYGEVLKAKKNETNKNDYDVYALKRYRNEENESEEEAAYFLKTQYREINILKKVSGHPNIVNFIDSGKDYEDNLYLVMEYLPYTALNLISSINSISISFNISGKKGCPLN